MKWMTAAEVHLHRGQYIFYTGKEAELTNHQEHIIKNEAETSVAIAWQFPGIGTLVKDITLLDQDRPYFSIKYTQNTFT